MDYTVLCELEINKLLHIAVRQSVYLSRTSLL